MSKSQKSSLHFSLKKHMWNCGRLAFQRYQSSWRATELEQRFRRVTKSCLDQQRKWSQLKHLELLTKYDRGTKRVEQSIARAMEPLVSKSAVKRATKIIMVEKVKDAKKELAEATCERGLAKADLRRVNSWNSYPGAPKVLPHFYNSLQDHLKLEKHFSVTKVEKKEEYLARQEDIGTEWWRRGGEIQIPPLICGSLPQH